MIRVNSALHQASLCVRTFEARTALSTITSISITSQHYYHSAFLSSAIPSQTAGNSFDLESVLLKQKQPREVLSEGQKSESVWLMLQSPLTRRHKDFLRGIGFTYRQRLGGNGFQAKYDWRHGDYPNVLESHSFVKHAGYEDSRLKLSPLLIGDSAPTDLVTMDVTLHGATGQSLEMVAESIRDLTGQHEAAITTNKDTSTIHVAVQKEQVIAIARLPGVNTVHEPYEQVPYSNVARRIFKVDEAET
ncbi:hypothetical protein BDV33DRAFT_200754 [Aspergillus novoparasiticus]|uniref:Uncharacterized protein n=1 Tax=Aspergillus novoparasiticus TaxID=986946 RepID=A0A5N6F377_9EURO|nr:hypothetical protein BDV33DRAFT_200754 [Aspergillus novoparasiticus]